MTGRSRCQIPAAVLTVSFFIVAPAHAQRVLYVDAEAPGPTHDGSSWCEAFLYLQDALAAAATSGNEAVEIRVAQGVYTPDRDTANPNGTDYRGATFQLLSSVTLLGGYAGCGAPDPDGRDVDAYETILSGDLGGNDVGYPGDLSRDENAYHVVTASGADWTAVVDGFSITAGNADGVSPNDRGGGLYNNSGSPTVRNCAFRGNTATFGGALNNEHSSPTITNCVFRGNFAGFSGGGIRGWQSNPTITNCAFIANIAEAGGGMWHGGSNPTLTNCTFFANSATDGSALSFGSCCPQQPSNFQAANCILWDGGSQIFNDDESTITITHSDVQDDEPGDSVVYPGTGNVDLPPLFVPGPGGCYYLSQTAAGYALDSPCVDAGDDTASNLGLDAMTTRSDEATDAGIVDMGYHYPVTGAPLVMGDYDRSGRVDLRDFAAMQCCFTSDGPTDVTPCCRIFDITPDADVDLSDFAEFRSAMNGP